MIRLSVITQETPLSLAIELDILIVTEENGTSLPWSQIKSALNDMLGSQNSSHGLYTLQIETTIVNVDDLSKFDQGSRQPDSKLVANLLELLKSPSLNIFQDFHQLDNHLQTILTKSTNHESTTDKIPSKCGQYILFLFHGLTALSSPANEKPTAVIGKYRHAWISTPSESHWEDQIFPLISSTVLSGILGQEKGGKLPGTFPLGSSRDLLLSFSLLNAGPQPDWLYGWYN